MPPTECAVRGSSRVSLPIPSGPYLAATTPCKIIAQRAISRSAWHLALQSRLPSHAYAAQSALPPNSTANGLEPFLTAADLAVVAGERQSPGGTPTKPLPEPALGSLPPRGQAWEMTRYRAYQAQLAGRTIGEIFSWAAELLKLAAANTPASTDSSVQARR